MTESHASQMVVVSTSGGGMSSSMSVQSSSSMSSSSAVQTSSSVETSGNVTSKSTTTVKTTKTVRSHKTTTKSSTMSSMGMVQVKSSSDSFANQMGIDVDQEMANLMSKMDMEMSKVRQEVMHLTPLQLTGSANQMVKLDDKSIMDYVDDKNKDRMKLNFDVNEFESESISVKTVGNKIEVHAKKKSKKGDLEASEEYSRSYELPTNQDVDPGKVTSSFYKDGVLTVELPVEDAKK